MSGPRKSTPRGNMTRGANSGPAVMLMPPHIRSTFMPNPPLAQLRMPASRRKQEWTGVAAYMSKLETTAPPERVSMPTPAALAEQRRGHKLTSRKVALEPAIQAYREQQRGAGGEFSGMNCYNTLFVGRLATEVTERKLLREMEAFGPVKDVVLVVDKEASKSRGYAFIEFEHEEDMKRAYRAADGIRLEGRHIVVDVERGHTVPVWLPRRLGGGLGGTRLGGKQENYTRPGRFDPARPEASMNGGGGSGGGGMGMGRGGGPPPPQYGGGGGGRGGGFRDGPPQGGGYGMGRGGGGGGNYGGGGGGNYGGGGGDRYGGGGGRGGGGNYGGGGGDRYGGGDRKRHRSPSPDRRYGGGDGGGQRRRY